MQSQKRTPKTKPKNSVLGFEATLWATTDKLRGNLDVSEVKMKLAIHGIEGGLDAGRWFR